MVFSPPSLWTIGKDLHGEPAGSGRRFRTAGMSGTASERRTPPGGGGSYEHNPDSGRWTFCLVLGQIECQTPQPAEAEKKKIFSDQKCDSDNLWQQNFFYVWLCNQNSTCIRTN